VAKIQVVVYRVMTMLVWYMVANILKACAISSYPEDSGNIFLGNTGTNLPDCLVP